MSLAVISFGSEVKKSPRFTDFGLSNLTLHVIGFSHFSTLLDSRFRKIQHTLQRVEGEVHRGKGPGY